MDGWMDGMCFPIIWAFLTPFSGVPYPGWYTERQKSHHGAIEIAVPYPYTLSVFRTRVHVNNLIDNYIKKFLPYAVYRMPYAGCFMLVNAA